MGKTTAVQRLLVVMDGWIEDLQALRAKAAENPSTGRTHWMSDLLDMISRAKHTAGAAQELIGGLPTRWEQEGEDHA